MNSVETFSGMCNQKLLRHPGGTRRCNHDARWPPIRNNCDSTDGAPVRGDMRRFTPIEGVHVHYRQARERLLVGHPVPWQPDESAFQMILDPGPTRTLSRIETLHADEPDVGLLPQQRGTHTV